MAYRGVIAHLPIGGRGLTGSSNTARLQPDQLIRAEGIDISEGYIRKEGGADLFTSSDVGNGISILGGIDYTPSIGTQRNVIAVSSGDVLMDGGTGAFGTRLASGRNASARAWFTEGGNESSGRSRKLFAANGADAVLVVTGDGTATGDLSVPPADWTGSTQPHSLVPHRGRLWGLLNDRVYYSQQADHENFLTSDAGSISVWPGVGGRLRAGMSFKGRLFLWKNPKGILWIDDSNATASNWLTQRLTEAIGTISQDTVAMLDDDVAFLTPEGALHLLSAVDTFGDARASDLSWVDEINNWIRDNVNMAQLDVASLNYYPTRRQLYIALPLTDSTVANGRLVVDFGSKVPRWTHSQRDTAISMWTYRDTDGIPRPMHGDNDGHVYAMDKETRTKEGVGAYTADFQIAHTDFGWMDPKIAQKRKNYDFFEAVYEQAGDWDTVAEFYGDGVLRQTSLLNMAQTSSTLGTFTLGEDELLGLAVASPNIRRVRLTYSARYFGYRLISTGDSQEYKIMGANVGFRVSDERPQA